MEEEKEVPVICSGCTQPISPYVTYWEFPDGVTVHGAPCYELFLKKEDDVVP